MLQVVKIEAHEADDVVASLVGQVLSRGYRVVIASPDKDFKQLISENVQIVMPFPDLNRWSYYTLKHYVAQYSCDPQSDLSISEYQFSQSTIRFIELSKCVYIYIYCFSLVCLYSKVSIFMFERLFSG